MCVIALQRLDSKVGEGSYTQFSFTLPCKAAPVGAVPDVDRASSNSSSGVGVALSWSGAQARASLSTAPAAPTSTLTVHVAAAEAGEAGEEEVAKLQGLEGTMAAGRDSSSPCLEEGARLGWDVLIVDDNNINRRVLTRMLTATGCTSPLSLSLLFIPLYLSIVICILL